MKDAYYFSHDANARNDEKILMLRADYGWEAYGIFWVLIEMMFESSETCLHLSKVKGIATSNNIDITLLQQIINTAIAEGLFVLDDDVFYSQSLRDRKEKFNDLRNARSEAGKKGMESRYKSKVDNTVITPLQQCNNTPITNSNKVKEKKEKGKEKESKNTYADFVTMTESEYNKLIEQHGEELTKAFITKLNAHKGANGKTYKSDYLAILNWVVDAVKEKQGKQPKAEPDKPVDTWWQDRADGKFDGEAV